uniref:Uncharacterized protein n=1 Tax=Ficedula albicollis TaxID=59894 RepID=A0A803WFG2_FICAL
MAEDHDLTDDEAAVEVAEGPVLLVQALAHHEVLPDVAEGELLLPQLDHNGVRDDPLRKEQQHLAEPSWQQSSPVDADALTGEALHVDHDVGLVQHEQGDLCQVQDALFEAPVQCGARCSNDDLLLQRCALQNFHLDVSAEFPNGPHHLPDLQSQLIGGSQAEALQESRGRSC